MSSSTTWTFALVLLVVAVFYRNCDAILNQPKCHRFYPNKTLKLTNDIDIKVGENLEVDCILPYTQNESEDGTLSWSVNQSYIPSDMTKRLNATTLRLNLQNARTNQSGHYKCLQDFTVKEPTPKSKGICFTRIRVGYPPFPVVDFSCTVYNLDYMECIWTSTPNPVPVTYYLDLVYYRDPEMFTSHCIVPRSKLQNRYTYNFTSSSSCVPYHKFRKVYDFMLTGKNSLGSSIWNFTIDHFSIVIPGQLENVRVTPLEDVKSFNISYQITNSMKYYEAGVLFRLLVKSQWGDSRMLFENETSTVLSNLRPYTNYTIGVSCVANLANKEDESMWSTYAFVNFQTLPEIPDAPPDIVPGSFRTQSYINHTDITLYWKAIPDKLKNGRSLTYIVIAESLNTGVKTSLTTNQGSITFSNLSHTDSYLFHVYSHNEIGNSNSSSTIAVGPNSALISKPSSITVTAYSPFLHNIKWLPAPNVSLVSGYRIFWIESDSKFQVNPKGSLFWKDVGKNFTKENITVSGIWPYHHFGVSSIGQNSASGIIWNTCIVLFNGTVAKMKYVEALPYSSTAVTVKWNIDCAEKLGVVTGFNIYYCKVDDKNDDICNDVTGVDFQGDDNAVSYVLQNLKPYTFYKITVAVVTEAGEGEQSRPLFAQTFEDAPENAVNYFDLMGATNNSFLVKWHPPNTTNGIITYYEIYYSTDSDEYKDTYKPNILMSGPETTYWQNVTDKVVPFANYTVSFRACNKVGCSPLSDEKQIRTDIGVPLQMDPPQVRLVNLTYAVVHPEMNCAFNGPSPTWDMKTIIVTSDNHTYEEKLYRNLTFELTYVPFNCEDPQMIGSKMELQTRAANFKDSGEVLLGEWSDYAKLNCLEPSFSIGIIIAIIVAAAVGLTIIILVILTVTRKLQDVFKTIPAVQLPDGLVGIIGICS